MIMNHRAAGSLTRRIPWTVLILGIMGLPFLPAMASEQPAREETQEVTQQKQRRDESPKTAPPSSKSEPRPAEPATPKQPPGKASKAPPKVRVAQPVRREVRDFLILDAKLDAAATVELRAQVGGRIDKVLCRPGQKIEKGDVLFQIDPSPYQAEVKKAQAEVRRAQARVKRLAAQRTRTQESVKNHTQPSVGPRPDRW